MSFKRSSLPHTTWWRQIQQSDLTVSLNLVRGSSLSSRTGLMLGFYTCVIYLKFSILHSFYLWHKRTRLGIKIYIQSLFDSQTMHSDLKITSKCLTTILFHRDLEQPNGSVLFRSNSPAEMDEIFYTYEQRGKRCFRRPRRFKFLLPLATYPEYVMNCITNTWCTLTYQFQYFLPNV